MKVTATLLAGAAVIAMSLSAIPADAREWHGHGGYGWHGGYHHHHDGGAIALGVLGGLAGAAIASSAYPYYYGYSYPYYGYPYGYYYPY
jgi:hypothetical protein